MAVLELFEVSREGAFDGVNAQTRRRFIVDATRETALIQAGVPQRGSGYDWNGRTLTCDRVEVSGTSDPAKQYVDAYYSTNGRYTIPDNNDDQAPGYNNFSETYQRSPVKVPAFRRVNMEAPAAGGGPPAPSFTYEQIDYTDDNSYFGNLRIVLNRKSYTFNDRSIIRAQRGTIHRFSPTTGERWRFQGADVTSSTPGQWRYEYAWITDPGTPKIQTALPVEGDNIITPDMDRPPFYRYYVYTQSGINMPIITVLPAYADQENPARLGSWNTLPGNPIGVLG